MKTLSKLDTQNQSTNTCPETELVFCCARTQIDSATAERIKTLVEQDINWEYLLKIANWHGVMPLLYWSLKNSCPESIPQAQLDYLRKAFQANSYRNLVLTQQLIQLLGFLEKHEIPALPFKGPLLAASIYGNLSLRRISDLDILVHQQDFQKAADLLVDRGYEYWLEAKVKWECHLVKNDGISNIDLHCEIVPKHLSCAISNNYWWDSLEKFSLAGNVVPNLSPEAWFLIISLNGTKECWKSLNRICDVAEVLRAYPNMDWNKILQQAKKLGFQRLIFVAIILAKNLLEAPVPESLWQQIQKDAFSNTLATQISQQLFVESNERILEVHRTLFHIKTRERPQDKVRIFMDLMNYSGWLALTEKDLNFVSLPKSLYFLYYFIRPIRILNKYRKPLLKYVGIKKDK